MAISSCTAPFAKFIYHSSMYLNNLALHELHKNMKYFFFWGGGKFSLIRILKEYYFCYLFHPKLDKKVCLILILWKEYLIYYRLHHNQEIHFVGVQTSGDRSFVLSNNTKIKSGLFNLTFDGVFFTLIFEGGRIILSTFFFTCKKTIEKVNVWEEFYCMVKYRQISSFAEASKDLVSP